MKEKSIVMKMLFEKLNAAFSGSGYPSYRISIDDKTDMITVADSDYEYEPVVFKSTANLICGLSFLIKVRSGYQF